MKCDFPDPKKPETQIPFWLPAAGLDSIAESRTATRSLMYLVSSRDHKFVELLPDRRGVKLIGFNHTVNVAVDIALEKFLNFHDAAPPGTKIKAR